MGFGQDLYGSPSVFSFLLPKYAPSGMIRKAELVAPESQVLTGKHITKKKHITKCLDGLFTGVKFGLVDYYGGFDDTVTECPTTEGNSDINGNGFLLCTFQDTASADDALDDLVLLLTAERLGNTNRDIIKADRTRLQQ